MENIDFVQIGKKHPCDGCPAPCCITQTMATKTPQAFMDLDWLGYMLNFPNTELIFSVNNDWSVIKWTNCSNFIESSCRCKVHNTTSQPRTCFYYNPWNCWYKKNFVTEVPPDMIRLNKARFESWAQEVVLDENRRIISFPSFERARELVNSIPITPNLKMNQKERLPEEVNKQ